MSDSISLERHEVICPKCNGKPHTEATPWCGKCLGKGKVDWIAGLAGKDKTMFAFDIETTQLTAKERQLQAEWSIDAAQDLSDTIDAEILKEMTNLIVEDITNAERKPYPI